MNLLLKPCTQHAVKYACTNWHYSKCVPVGKLFALGIWEDGEWIGVIIFSRGGNNYIGAHYNLAQTEICELTRIALKNHRCSISKCISVAVKILKKYNPGIKLVVSYADPAHGHRGTVYQAGNWVYEGIVKSRGAFLGKW